MDSLDNRALRNGGAPLPLVSVLVPVYNAEQHLLRCLRSVYEQTYCNVEIVAVDDGSTDGSAALLDQEALEHPDLLVVEHEANAGAAAARNRAMTLARGEYLCFMDNDDWLDADFLEQLVHAAQTSEADVVCAGYRRPTETGKVLFEAIPHKGEEWAPYLVEAAWAKLYRTAFVREGGYRFLDTNIDEDLYFTLPLLMQAKRVDIVSSAGYNWFYNTKSVSNTSQRTSQGLRFEQTMNDILGELVARGLVVGELERHYFVRLITWFLLFTRKGDGRRKARENLRHYRVWLDRNLPGWRKDRYATPQHPTGDAPKNRLAVWLFVRHAMVFGLALDAYGLVS